VEMLALWQLDAHDLLNPACSLFIWCWKHCWGHGAWM